MDIVWEQMIELYASILQLKVENLKSEGITKIFTMQLFRAVLLVIMMKQFVQLKWKPMLMKSILMEASALVAMVDAKLRDPSVTLGSDGFQRLLSSSGIIKTQTVKDQFS